jgi:hypothetical protein
MLLFLSRAGRGDGERFRPNARFFEEIARSSLARASRRRIRPDKSAITRHVLCELLAVS